MASAVLEALRADACGGADTGRSAPGFREGQPDPGESLSSTDRHRLQSTRAALDPAGLFAFARSAAP